MSSHRARSAVCTITIDRQPTGVLITIQMVPDVSRPGLSKTHATNIDEAITAVTEFLRSFIEK